MCPVYSVTSATDPHSPYAMIIVVGYMRVPHWNIRLTFSLWLKIQEFLSKTLGLRFVHFRYFLGFHSSINNLPFLLLYEFRLLDNWLQTFREDVRIAFFKMSKWLSQFSSRRYNKNFHRHIRETTTQWRGCLTARLVVSKKRYWESVARVAVNK